MHRERMNFCRNNDEKFTYYYFSINFPFYVYQLISYPEDIKVVLFFVDWSSICRKFLYLKNLKTNLHV